MSRGSSSVEAPVLCSDIYVRESERLYSAMRLVNKHLSSLRTIGNHIETSRQCELGLLSRGRIDDLTIECVDSDRSYLRSYDREGTTSYADL